MTVNEWRRLRAQVKEQDRDAEPAVLAPAEAFDDRRPGTEFVNRFHPHHDPRQLGPNSLAVRARLGSSCAGWPQQPEAGEFYAAIRARRPNSRQADLIHMWLQEASREDFLYAWAEGVYTWRELARAIHAARLQQTPRCADLNTLVA